MDMKGVSSMRVWGIILMSVGFSLGIFAWFCVAVGSDKSNYSAEDRVRLTFDEDYKKENREALSGIAGAALFFTAAGFAGIGLTIGGTARINRKRRMQMQQTSLPVLTLGRRFSNMSKQFALTFNYGGHCFWEQNGMRFNGSYMQIGYNEWEVRVENSDSVLRVQTAGDQIIVRAVDFCEYFY